MRAMREFCTGILKVKLDISADNRAEIDGLKEALAAFDRPAGLYEAYAATLRAGRWTWRRPDVGRAIG